MAKKKAEKQARKKKPAKRRGSGFPFLGLCALVTAIVFMPTTILLFFGMLPTVVAAVIDRSGRGAKALTVGAMNLAGCTLYLLDLWTTSHTADYALTLASDPRNIITMYLAAGVGYLIDWMMAGIVTTIIIQRSTQRLKEIGQEKEELVQRWGREVTGELPLDAYGFPVDGAVAEPEAPN